MNWTELRGNNICFQPIGFDIVEDLHDYASDEDVSRFIGWPLTTTLEESKAYVQKLLDNEMNKTHEYASIMLEGKHIGTIMLFNFDKVAKHLEIGYVLSKKYWHMGYVSEAVQLVIDYIDSETDYHKVCGRVVSTNEGSSRVLEKAGFKLEGRQVDQYFIEGRYYDALHYGYIK